MDKTRIIQQGEEAKFLVNIKGFDMHAGMFYIDLIYGYRQTVLGITKDMMIETQEGWILIFHTDGMVGKVTARCTWDVDDLDCPDLLRTKVEEQVLCFVVAVPCPQLFTCPDCGQDDYLVTYTRTEQSDIAERYSRLLDCNGLSLLTADNEFIYVLTETVENEN